MKRIPIKRTGTIKKIGKKTSAWIEVKKELKEKFASLGILSCELGLEGCLKDTLLGFAHSKKRAKIKTDEDLREVILACVSCHEKIESTLQSEMYRIVTLVIGKRKIK